MMLCGLWATEKKSRSCTLPNLLGKEATCFAPVRFEKLATDSAFVSKNRCVILYIQLLK